jgi:uncharacterized Zn finger protein (UPF0148 family)
MKCTKYGCHLIAMDGDIFCGRHHEEHEEKLDAIRARKAEQERRKQEKAAKPANKRDRASYAETKAAEQALIQEAVKAALESSRRRMERTGKGPMAISRPWEKGPKKTPCNVDIVTVS